MGGTASKQKGRTSSKHSQLEIADRPSPPGKPQLVPGTPSSEPDVVTISWEPPKYDGGSKITGYLVEHRRTGSPHWVRASPILVRQPELTLSGLEPGWRYQFRVSAKNAVGYSEPGELSELLTVTLQRSAASAPHFVKELKDTVALENEKAELSVQVKGTPPPTIAWYKDGLEIYSSRRQKILTENDTSTLLFYQAALSDEGEIKCTATNRVGHAVTRARLRLEAPPSIRLPRQYEEGLIFEKDEVIRLRVAIVGRPVPDVAWIHNGEVLPHGGRYEIGHSERHASLRIDETRRSDRGEYQVRAFNKLGEDVASFLVTVTDRPMPPGKARVAMTLGRTVSLSWSTPDDDGGCKIGNYIVEYYRIGWNMWLKAATCRQLATTLGDLIEGSEYKFRVKAENPYGVSDPSEESDVIFIPDPKRGLMEPPERGAASLDSTYAIEHWLDERKHPLATTVLHDNAFSAKRKKKNHEVSGEGGEKPLVGQNLSKSPVIKNFKSFHSEDSMSPTVTPEPEDSVDRKSKPVVPKRKVKSDKILVLNEKNEEKVPSERNNSIDEEGMGLDIMERSKWKNLTPRDEDDMLHGSSEMMLVLLPNSRAATEERDYLRKSDFFTSLEESGAVAPPMSLSAPELGYEDDLVFPPIRTSVSSSELLHQRTMSRFYQDITEEEHQCTLKRRTSIERRRSFERRSSTKGKELMLPVIKDKLPEDIQESFENVQNKDAFTSKMNGKLKEEKYNENDPSNRLKRPLWASVSESNESVDREKEYLKRDNLVTQSSEEEYEEDYSEEDEYQEEIRLNEIKYVINEEERDVDEDLEDNYEEDDDESDNYNISESEDSFRHLIHFEEDTYHPRNMIPKIKNSVEPKIWTEVNKNDQSNSLLSALNINNEVVTSSSIKSQNTYDSDDKIVESQDPTNVRSRLGSHKSDMNALPEHSTDKKCTSKTSSIMPKPILKVRDHSQERPVSRKGKHQAPIADVEAELNIVSKAVSDNVLNVVSTHIGNDVKLRKKTVRIEEPVEMTYIISDNIENEMGISAGEVARNRRRRSGSLGEEADPLKIVISHYSDIVAEYGKTKRGPSARYLNYEELRAAAQTEDQPIERSTTQNEEQYEDRAKSMEEELLPLTRPLELTTPLQIECESEEAKTTSETPAVTVRRYTVTERKMRSLFDFAMDLVLFVVACWLYAFKDERLAIPILLLMLYRQTFEAIKRRLPSKWRRK